MSRIEAQLQELRERERQLGLAKRKIEFLNHILDSAKKYNHKDYAEIKDSVTDMLAQFVAKATDVIEGGEPTAVESPQTPQTFTKEEKSQPKTSPKSMVPGDLSPADKLNFAMDNRALAGQTVTVANDKNLTIKGKVVGLDAPFVIVAVDGGPTIKVPRDNVALL